MVNFAYSDGPRLLAEGGLDLRESGADLRVLLVMELSTAGSQPSAVFVSDITTLDEHNGANYARQSLSAQAVMKNGAPDYDTKLTAANVVFPNLGVGSRKCRGAIVYVHSGADSANRLLYWIGHSGFPFDANGLNATIAWNTAGVSRLKPA